ncbi:hypothetical protein CRG98_020593, partial [Punica granatum]
ENTTRSQLQLPNRVVQQKPHASRYSHLRLQPQSFGRDHRTRISSRTRHLQVNTGGALHDPSEMAELRGETGSADGERAARPLRRVPDDGVSKCCRSSGAVEDATALGFIGEGKLSCRKEKRGKFCGVQKGKRIKQSGRNRRQCAGEDDGVRSGY